MVMVVSAVLLSYVVSFVIVVCKNSVCFKFKLFLSKVVVFVLVLSKVVGLGLFIMFMGRFIVLFIMCNCGFLLCNKSLVAASYIFCASLMDLGNI